MPHPQPVPPYYAVIFSSQMADDEGYGPMAAAMVSLAESQPGYLGIESARDEHGAGITVSYWQTEADIAAWKNNAAHVAAQQKGKDRHYERFEVRVARVDRAYSWP